MLIYILIAFSLLYTFTIIAFTIGWSKLKPISNNNSDNKYRFSIIIPFYNEEENIKSLLEDLSKINYPKHSFEIIMVNNESTDETGDIVRDYIFENDSEIKLHISDGSKKDAIWLGINNSIHDYILSIDGDCRVPANILNDYNNALNKKISKIISGPVAFSSNNSLWGKFMEFEFMSLVASGAGAIGIKKPIMLNAANMLFEKEMALKARHIYKSDEVSGDDIFLMMYAIKNYGNSSIQFLKNQNSIISTNAPSSFKSWVNQRLRWAAKAKHYTINTTSITAIIILAFNILASVMFPLGIINPDYAILSISAFLLKTIIDLPLLYSSSAFFNKKHLVKYILLFELIYPYYVVIISFYSLFYKENWKNE